LHHIHIHSQASSTLAWVSVKENRERNQRNREGMAYRRLDEIFVSKKPASPH